MTDDDCRFLAWVADRLTLVYGDNPNADFIHKLRALATPAAAPVPTTTFEYRCDCGSVHVERYTPPVATPVAPETPMCAAWCGLIHDQVPNGANQYLTALTVDNRIHAFCTCECMLAGKPTHPHGTP